MSTSLIARDSKFFLDGKEIVLVSGAMHYFRVVPEYWKDRLLKMKACGLNCIETYVPWNWHEEVRGEFNFEGMLDIRKFIQTAQEVGLYVLLRPGPYICSEWEFGGLPSWLLRDPDMRIRSPYRPYLEAVDGFFSKLFPQVNDLQHSKGGPIIAVQIENEYGSYGDDIDYKTFLKENMTRHGVCEMFFTSDNGMGVQTGQIPGVLMTVNLQEIDHAFLIFEYLKNHKQPGLPLMVMEFWTGWFDHWGEKRHIIPVEKFANTLSYILKQNSSVNFYMFHGGTNWGFMNGANEGLGATNEAGLQEPYAADITSYDYDCQIAENGDLTPKYYKTREILQQLLPAHVPSTLPDPPAPIERKAYGEVSVSSHMTFEDILSFVKPFQSSRPLNMEELDMNNGGGQSYGFILYRTQIGKVNRLTFTGKVKDRAIVLLNGEQTDTFDWIEPAGHVTVLPTAKDTNVLDILVENAGRVNYADFRSPIMDAQRKGLGGDLLADNTMVKDFHIYPLEFKKRDIQSLSASTRWRDGALQAGAPGIARISLNIEGQPKDTHLKLPGWRKGVIFINGFNLGRYWDIGPQKTYYVPAPLLQQGHNEILILELHEAASSVTFTDQAELGEEMEHQTVLPWWANIQISLLKNVLGMGSWVWYVLRWFMK